MNQEALTARQLRELAYHQERARAHRSRAEQPVNTSIVFSRARRPWNAYWTFYTILLDLRLAGKRVLVPGCGFGEDAILLAELGAEVSAFDLSDGEVEVARQRAKRHGVRIDFRAMAAEKLAYPDNTFDAVLLVDILHHVDIPAAMSEITRVLRPGGWVVGNEIYTHSTLNQVRQSRFVRNVLHPRMCRFIYGTDRPYITADERKINESEFALVLGHCANLKILWFNAVASRLFPSHFRRLAQLDRTFMSMLGGLGRFFAGRVVFRGQIRKPMPADIRAHLESGQGDSPEPKFG